MVARMLFLRARKLPKRWLGDWSVRASRYSTRALRQVCSARPKNFATSSR
jgi:hypothetical protein